MAIKDKIESILELIIIAYLFYSIFIKVTIRKKNYQLGVESQHNLKEFSLLLNSTKQVQEIGWSKKYLKEFNYENLASGLFGIKFLKYYKYRRFNFYSFIFKNKCIQIMASNQGIASFFFVIIFDFETNWSYQKQLMLFPYFDSEKFPDLQNNIFNCTEGNFQTFKNNFSLKEKMYQSQNKTCNEEIKLKIEEEIELDLNMQSNLDKDNFYNYMPITNNNRYFEASLKQIYNKCKGNMRVFGMPEEINEENCLGFVGFSRGLYLYKTNWQWVLIQGFDKKGNKLSISLLEGLIYEESESNDDYFQVNERVVKLNPVQFYIDQEDFMKPGRFRTGEKFWEKKENNLNVTFRPTKIVQVKNNYLVTSVNIKYVYGYFDGIVTDDQGESFEFANAKGYLENLFVRA